MRRTLTVFLILLFWLGPFAAILPASAESRLPACCRRHGAHHCTMSAEEASELAQVSSGSAPALTAPAHCPSFPGSQAASITPVHELAVSAASLPTLLSRAHSPGASRAAARLSQVRTSASRGPPTSNIG